MGAWTYHRYTTLYNCHVMDIHVTDQHDQGTEDVEITLKIIFRYETYPPAPTRKEKKVKIAVTFPLLRLQSSQNPLKNCVSNYPKHVPDDKLLVKSLNLITSLSHSVCYPTLISGSLM